MGQDKRFVTLNFDDSQVNADFVSLGAAHWETGGWRVIFQGVWKNNADGASLVQPAPYIEVSALSSTGYADLVIGTRTLRLIREDAHTGRIIGYVLEAGGLIGFCGTVTFINNGVTANGTDSIAIAGNLKIGGALDHNGTTVGFYGTAPATQHAAIANATDAASAITQLNLALATLRALGLIAT
jgi:hypothetical protein